MGRVILFFAVVLSMLVMSGLAFAQNAYFEFDYLNNGDVDVGTTWVKLDTGTHVFTKNQNNTQIEVYVNSRFGVDSLDVPGVFFAVRIDDVLVPDHDSWGSVLSPDHQEFVSFLSVFENIPAGNHTVSIWARVYGPGSAYGVLVDPGGWGGSMIVKVIDDNALSMAPGDPVPSDEFSMHQNYPNPFNPRTRIEYTVRESSPVNLKVYNTLGQLVRTLVDDYKITGEYSVMWDGTDNSGNKVPSGAYYYQIKMGEFTSTRKMIHVE